MSFSGRTTDFHLQAQRLGQAGYGPCASGAEDVEGEKGVIKGKGPKLPQWRGTGKGGWTTWEQQASDHLSSMQMYGLVDRAVVDGRPSINPREHPGIYMSTATPEEKLHRVLVADSAAIVKVRDSLVEKIAELKECEDDQEYLVSSGNGDARAIGRALRIQQDKVDRVVKKLVDMNVDAQLGGYMGRCQLLTDALLVAFRPDPATYRAMMQKVTGSLVVGRTRPGAGHISTCRTVDNVEYEVCRRPTPSGCGPIWPDF